MLEINSAVVARWNAKGLNTSIAPLRPAGSGGRVHQNVGGAPEGSGYPLAEYTTSVIPGEKTRNSRYYQGVVQLQVWTESPLDASTYVDVMRDAFVNSEASAGPSLDIANGEVLDVSDGSSFSKKYDDTNHLAYQQLTVKFSIRNRVPA